MTPRELAFFEARVRRSDGCWEWTGRRSRYGYGRVLVEGRERGAHRVAYEMSTGVRVPDHLDVCHRCDNRLCVRAEHLFVGTRADNSADMVAKGRQAKGEKNGQCRLTAEQVLDLRRRASAGESIVSLAKSVPVSMAAVWLAVRGKNWKHLPGAVS
jgi:hypothetical protein